MTEPAGVDGVLRDFVEGSLVEGRELHARVPVCWAEHPGVVTELAHLYGVVEEATSASELAAYDDAVERVLGRIRSQYPTAECLARHTHQVPARWPGQADQRAQARAEARNAGRTTGGGR